MTKNGSEIVSRIEKVGDVEWRKCKWLQPSNLKRQSRAQKEKLKRSLVGNGFASVFYVWEHRGSTWILDGHHRESTMRDLEQNGLDGVPVSIPARLPAAFIRCKNKKDAIKLCLLYSSQYAKMNEEVLFEFASDFDRDDLLFEVDIPGVSLSDFGKVAVGGPEEIPEPPKKPTTKPGEVWCLGDHVLVCGDAADAKSMAAAMGSSKARLYNTDPPYGVSLGGAKAGMAGFEKNQVQKPVQGDDRRDDALQAFLETVFRNVTPHLDRAAWYLWHAHMTQGFFAAAAAAAADVILHRQIIWSKPGLVFTRSGMYHWQHEPCFFGWVKGQQPEFYGRRNQTTVWECGAGGGGLHATQKPVELFAIPMRNHTLIGDVCLDTFAGSGSQIIAAEQLSRSCRALEIEPAYCDVIIERWQNVSGGKAKRVGSIK